MSNRQEQIKQDVIEQLKWDSRVNEDNIQVEVVGNTVVLAGTLPTYWAKLAAAEDCESVAGVRDVDNQLSVPFSTTGQPTESEIRENIERALQGNANIDSKRVSVALGDGVVTLEGSIDSLWKKQLTERIASEFAGVVSIDNRLTIVPTQVVADEAIASNILDAIRRNMMVEAESIEIHVAGGVASMRGTVSSRAAQRAAKDIAVHTAGVVDLEDNLAIAN